MATNADRHGRHRRTRPERRHRPDAGFQATRKERFERLVDQAALKIPEELLAQVDNLQVVVEEVPPADVMGEGDEVLLGLYEGVPKTARGDLMPALPDRITLFRRPIEARATSREHLQDIVTHVLIHEIAHHFGIDDDRLDELGW